MNLKDKVIVRTYNKDQVFNTRAEAIAEVKTWCESSEGSEQRRYCTVLCKLLGGRIYCTDEE